MNHIDEFVPRLREGRTCMDPKRRPALERVPTTQEVEVPTVDRPRPALGLDTDPSLPPVHEEDADAT